MKKGAVEPRRDEAYRIIVVSRAANFFRHDKYCFQLSGQLLFSSMLPG
jgi:hypothetical protein